MQRLLLFHFLLGLILLSCQQAHEEKAVKQEVKVSTDTLSAEEVPYKEYNMYYVVIADTGSDYFALRRTMFSISEILNHKIDTLERGFDVVKKKLKLADDSEDEIYAGEYYPRRFEGNFLSIEYLFLYADNANTTTMALVAGSFAEKGPADSLLQKIKPLAPKAQSFMVWEYEGCMH